MGRFSDALADNKGSRFPSKTDTKRVEKAFLVDNSVLSSKSRGLAYRFSPLISDKDKTSTAPLKLVGPRSRDARSIDDGTRLVVNEDGTRLFRSVNSPDTVRSCKRGLELVAAGRAVVSDRFEMVPIRPFDLLPFGGAVQLHLVELEAHYVRSPIAEFGSIVRGVERDDGWVQVGNLYLPQCIAGVTVLSHAWWEDHQKNDETENLRKATNTKGEVPSLRVDHQVEQVLGNKEDLIDPFDVSCLVPGMGALYEVVCEKAIIRREPSVSANLDNVKYKGDIVELFEWDASWQWRRCFDKSIRITGWMLLDHADRGPLLRPAKFPAKPWVSKRLVPSMAAVYENDTETLKKTLSNGEDPNFRIERGPSLLTMAIERGHMDCYVHLMAAGAIAEDYAPTLSVECDDYMEPKLRRVLISALSGRSDFKMEDFDHAISMLHPETQALADQIFDENARRWAKMDPDVTELPRFDSIELTEKEPEEKEVEAEEEYIKDLSTLHETEGEWYQVIHKSVWIRAEPNPGGAQLGMRKLGQRIQLFDYDETRKWRRCETGGENAAKELHEPVGMGWLLLHHPKLGNLVEPLVEDV